jgi:hypothetical protein
VPKPFRNQLNGASQIVLGTQLVARDGTSDFVNIGAIP